jgi:hypothetical protein
MDYDGILWYYIFRNDNKGMDSKRWGLRVDESWMLHWNLENQKFVVLKGWILRDEAWGWWFMNVELKFGKPKICCITIINKVEAWTSHWSIDNGHGIAPKNFIEFILKVMDFNL